MKELKIKFSHYYRKMPPVVSMLEHTTRLLHVFLEDVETFDESFISYDTAIEPIGCGNYYQLPKKGKVLVLLLMTDGHLWTTVRRFTPRKYQYYCGCTGSDFKIDIEEKNL